MSLLLESEGDMSKHIVLKVLYMYGTPPLSPEKHASNQAELTGGSFLSGGGQQVVHAVFVTVVVVSSNLIKNASVAGGCRGSKHFNFEVLFMFGGCSRSKIWIF